ncbi:MAG: PA0069 family radical SAM protein [Betaproteobacteria bacterium]
MDSRPIRIIKGRGTALRPQPRYDREKRELVDDGWTTTDSGVDEDSGHPVAPMVKTVVVERKAKSIISRNDSPDLPFSQSINPYLGCEHGCIYCYARPSYAYWDMSPGLDFETRLFAKTNAARLLREELARKSYRCEPIMLGANTDAYQPIEREWKITRQIVEILADTRHPLIVVTKSSLVERDLDLLSTMAARGLAHVCVSLGLLDGELARKLEPRAAAPQRRLQTIRTLAAAGIPVTVLVAPIIPQLNDKDMEAVLEQAREAGATSAFHVVLRLPHEVKVLFRDWLEQHYPLRAAHIMSLVQQMRGGKDYDAAFGTRMTGAGLFAELIGQRFAKACARLGFTPRSYALRTDAFAPPRPLASSPQLDLFDP